MPIFGSTMPDYPRGGGNGTKRLRKRAVKTTPIGQDLGDLRDELVRTMALLLSNGGALHLGMTSDGGALLVRAWLAGEKYEDYVTSSDELRETFEELQALAEGAQGRSTSKGPNGRKNGS